MTFQQPQEWEEALGGTVKRTISVGKSNRWKSKQRSYSSRHIEKIGRQAQTLHRKPGSTRRTQSQRVVTPVIEDENDALDIVRILF